MEGLAVFPYFIALAAVSLVVGLAASWVDRKVTARVQARVGPPWYQPVADILKLFGKETLVPENSRRAGFLLAPVVGFAGAAVAGAIILNSAISPDRGFIGDIVVLIYFLVVPSLALILGAFASGNPLAIVGGSREMKQLLALELPFLIVIATALYKASGGPLGAGSLRIGALIESQAVRGWFLWSLSGGIGFIVTMLCVQAKMGLVPFDAPEAEQEIMGGVLTEYSGVALALFKMSKAILLTALPLFVATVFMGGIDLHGFSIIAGLLKYLAVVVIIVLVRNTNPRLRIDQTLRFFWGPMTILALLGLIFAWRGW